MSRRKRPHPKRGRAPVRKPVTEHPLDGLFRVLGVKSTRRRLNRNKPDPDQPPRYGTSLR